MFLAATINANNLVSPSADLDFYLVPSIQRIYIRSHYDRLFSKVPLSIVVREGTYTVITGTPGVGKSLFACYCVWKLLHDEHTPANITSIVYRQTMKGETRVYAYERRGPASWQRIPNDSKLEIPSVFIYDSSDASASLGPILQCHNILITSPRVCVVLKKCLAIKLSH